MKKNVKKMIKSKLININTLVVNAHTPIPFISDVADWTCKNISFILMYHMI